MAFKMFVLFALMLVVLFVNAAPSASLGEEDSDILLIQNPDSSPMIVSLAELPSAAERNNLVCTAALCRNVCNALGYVFGRCNVNRVCVCSNF